MILSGLRHICGRLTHSIAVVAVIAALTLMSCSQDKPAMPSGEDQTGIVAFRVLTFKTTASQTMSRATATGNPDWNDEYANQGGNEFETALLKDQLYVVITDETCRTEYAVTNLVCTKVQENGITVAYEYMGRVNKEDLTDIATLTKGKLHIIANAGYKPQLSDENVFTLYGQPDNNFTAIPMWGVKTVDFSSINLEGPLNVGDVALLRSMAKVVIENDRSTDNDIKKLKSVAVSSVNTKGSLLPAQWSSIKSTTDLDRHSINLPDQTPIGPVVYDFNNDCVEFYLPEINNPEGTDELKLEITYETQEGRERIGTVYFRKYELGEPTDSRYDIYRNYLYKYTVKMTTSDLSAEVDVIPYTEVLLKPDFGIERDNETGWVIISKYKETYYLDDTWGVYYDKDKKAIATRLSPLETDDDHKVYVVRDIKTDKLKYVFDYTDNKYYLDLDRTQQLTKPDQCNFLPQGEFVDDMTVIVLRWDEYGKASYLYSPETGKVFNEYWMELGESHNFGIQRWNNSLGYSDYMVLSMDDNRSPIFFYDVANDKYYKDDPYVEGIKLEPVEAFPPAD